MGIVSNTLKGAKAKPTSKLMQEAGESARAKARPNPVKDRSVEKPVTPESIAKLDSSIAESDAYLSGMSPEDVARGGATIGGPAPEGPIKPTSRKPATVEDAKEVAESTLSPPPAESYKPRTLNRNINFDYVDTPDGNKAVIDTISKISRGFKSERRGVRSHEMTTQSALEIDPDTTLDKLMRRKPGEIWNAEQGLAARQALIDASSVVHRLARELTETTKGTPQLRADVSGEQLLEFRQAVSNIRAVQAAVQGNAAEVGRALNAYRIPTGEAGLAQINDLIADSGGIRTSRKMVEQFANLKTAQEIARNAEATAWAKAADLVHFYRINAMLSGPVTHARNIVGNAVYGVANVIEKAIAGTVVRPVREGLRRARGLEIDQPGVMPEEAFIQAVGQLSSWRDAFRLAGRAFTNQGQGTIGLTGKVEIRERRVPTDLFGGANNPLGKATNWMWENVIGTPVNLLGAEDEWFKTLYYRGALAQLSYREAKFSQPGDQAFDFIADEIGINPAKATDDQIELVRNALWTDLMNNPHGELHVSAVEQAKYQTFTDEPTGLADLAMKFRRHNGVRWILPFMRTPARIIQGAIERSPLGMAGVGMSAAMKRHQSELYQMLQAGGAEADEAATRLLVGNAMWGVVSMSVFEDKITGQGPPNKHVRKAEEDMGRQRSSLKIGNTYYSYRNIPVYGESLSGAATLAEALRYADSDEMVGAIWQAGVLGMAKDFSTKTYLQGFGEVMSLLDAPASMQTAKTEDIGASMITSFVPNVMKRVPESMNWLAHNNAFVKGLGIELPHYETDKIRRDTRSTVDFWDKVNRQFKVRLPGWSDDLPPAYNGWGQMITYQSWGPDWISPTYTKEGKVDDVMMAARNNAIYPNMPPETFPASSFNLVEFDPNNKGYGHVYSEYVAAVGRARYRRVERLLTGGPNGEPIARWQNAAESDEHDHDGFKRITRRGLLREAYSEGKADGLNVIKKKYPELLDILRSQEPPEVEPKRWQDAKF